MKDKNNNKTTVKVETARFVYEYDSSLLSTRDALILLYVVEGYNSDKIGKLLGISARTVLTIRHKLAANLGLPKGDLEHIRVRAVLSGLVKPTSSFKKNFEKTRSLGEFVYYVN